MFAAALAAVLVALACAGGLAGVQAAQAQACDDAQPEAAEEATSVPAAASANNERLLALASCATALQAASAQATQAALDGWVTEGGVTFYYVDGVLQTGWKRIGAKTYYFKKKASAKLPAGAMLTGLRTIAGDTYYFNKKGVMQTGWKRIDGERYFFRKKASSTQRKGAMLKGLQTIGGKQYYLGGAYSDEELDAAVEEQLSQMTLKEKIAQMFIVTPEALTQGSAVTKASSKLKKALETYPVGGIVYFSQNLKGTKQTKKLLKATMGYSLAASGLPLFQAVDEEGGTVARIAGNSAFGVRNVGNMSAIGASKKRKKAYKAGRYIGSYLDDLGFNLDFAPVADVLTNSKNTVVKYRSFGSSATLVSKMVSSEVAGLEEEGVLACIKHFPGHGATSADSHAGAAYVNKTLKQLKKRELVPFADQIEEGVPFIMVGHISLPKVTGSYVPASVSKKVVTGVLRKQMGYDGIIITDDMGMGAITQRYTTGEAAVKAVKAGVDVMLMTSSFKTAYKAVRKAVKQGKISEKRIDASVRRILKVKMALNS